FDRCISGELQRQQDTAQATLERMASQPEVEVDPAFNEFLADEVIRVHLDDLLRIEPNALQILQNAADHRAEFQRLFSQVSQQWVTSEHDKEGRGSWESVIERVEC